VEELQTQLGQKANTVSSMKQDARHMQQLLSEERSLKAALKQNLESVTETKNAAAHVRLPLCFALVLTAASPYKIFLKFWKHHCEWARMLCHAVSLVLEL